MRSLIFLTLAKHLNMINAQLQVFRLELDGRFQKEICIREHRQTRTNVREKAHALSVARVLLQIGANNLLGAQNTPLMEMVDHRDQFARQRLHTFSLRISFVRTRLITCAVIQIGQLFPAGDERRVIAHSAGIPLARTALVAHSKAQMSFFLKAAAEIRRRPFQAFDQG